MTWAIRTIALQVWLHLLVGCGPSSEQILDKAVDRGRRDSTRNDGTSTEMNGLVSCTTRISYGSRWIPHDRRTSDFEDVAGEVTWDGTCRNEGPNSYATLSNGWKRHFEGHDTCIIALDTSDSCLGSRAACNTRMTYASAWLHPDSHSSQYDDVSGVVSWSGECDNVSGGRSRARLSSGGAPHFAGSNACGVSFRYRQCGGLYNNPVVDVDCPDPGVARNGDGYVMACTGGRFRIYTSADLVHWDHVGHVFAERDRPTWARDRFWAPEIHEVRPGRWVAYYSAGGNSGRLAVGAAVSSRATGPFEDIGEPLVRHRRHGVIDVHYFRASDGQRYLTWKVDGNAMGMPTPIRIQRLADDGTTRIGNIETILINDRRWEGRVVEGQWLIERDGMFYLFYSGNAYDRTSYAVGVARATNPMGPYVKFGDPILTTNARWAGPGHGSAVRLPSGGWGYVYHSWVGDRVNQSPGPQVLVDRIHWSEGWPTLHAGPSSNSIPMP